MPISVWRPDTAKIDPFYGFNRFKTGTTDWTATPAIGGPSGYLEENQDAAYTRALAKAGIGLADQTPYADWVRNQFRNFQTGFKAGLAEDPTLTFQKYADDLLGPNGLSKLSMQFHKLAPRARGEFNSNWAGPMRTIST